MASQTVINQDHAIAMNRVDLENGVERSDIARSKPQAAATEQVVPRNWSFASSTSTLPVGKEQQPNKLPPKKYHRIVRHLRHTFLTVYRRLSFLTLLANVIVIIIFAAQNKLEEIDTAHIETAIAANLTAAILIRQDLIVNLLFATISKCPVWLPLRIRRIVAKIYHLGGIHAGASISAVVWYGFFNARLVNSYKSETKPDTVTLPLLVITLVLDFLLLTMIVISHPRIRRHIHDLWEAIHRYAGWTIVGLFWTHLFISLDLKLRKQPNTTLGQLICRTPIFWCLFSITISIILPWLRLLKVPVRSEELSDHAIRLHFAYTNVPLCTAPRFAKNPLRDWHAFAAIPEPDGQGFSTLVSNAGDWTSRVIQNPPTELWTKGWPTRGFLHVAPIFKKTLLVATGSGIGPILSLLHNRSLHVRILWSTRDPVAKYKSSIVDQVLLADPQAVIINTTESGWPDLVKEAYNLYKGSEAEAVFVISNPKTTRKTVYGLESRGVPTFAPVFDS